MVLAADPAGIPDCSQPIEKKGVVDFPGSGLMPSWIVGQLDMPDTLQVVLKGAGQIALHDLHVVDIVLQEKIVRADFLEEGNWISTPLKPLSAAA